jgi:DNA modification methylase
METVMNYGAILSNDPPLRGIRGKTTEGLKRLDLHGDLSKRLRSHCRLKYGEIWQDPVHGHRVGVLDATSIDDLKRVAGRNRAKIVINDPPYNVIVGRANTRSLSKISLAEYLEFSRAWISNAREIMHDNAHLFIWIGADYRDNFQPLPDLMILMRELKDLKPKNFITLRNQRGYGTQKNWMWIRQELLHYIKGKPEFRVTYTDIPKVLGGYYKEVRGRLTDNFERSRSRTIRPGNVWIDIQQVFYRMEENVPGCYAQKPLKAIERIISNCSDRGDVVFDFFSHSGTTLIAGERMKRRVLTFDIEPIFAEITIRRLEHFRESGETGFQWRNPFPEIEPKNRKRWL